MCQRDKRQTYDSRARDHVIVHLGLNVSRSAHNCGCVVDGGNLSNIIIIIIIIIIVKQQFFCCKYG